MGRRHFWIRLGSARVSRAGFGVSLKLTLLGFLMQFCISGNGVHVAVR